MKNLLLRNFVCSKEDFNCAQSCCSWARISALADRTSGEVSGSSGSRKTGSSTVALLLLLFFVSPTPVISPRVFVLFSWGSSSPDAVLSSSAWVGVFSWVEWAAITLYADASFKAAKTLGVIIIPSVSPSIDAIQMRTAGAMLTSPGAPSGIGRACIRTTWATSARPLMPVTLICRCTGNCKCSTRALSTQHISLPLSIKQRWAPGPRHRSGHRSGGEIHQYRSQTDGGQQRPPGFDFDPSRSRPSWRFVTVSLSRPALWLTSGLPQGPYSFHSQRNGDRQGHMRNRGPSGRLPPY